LPEICRRRLSEVEQLGNDGSHPPKMIGTTRPFQPLTHLIDDHRGLMKRKIHILWAGCEHHVHTRPVHQFKITLKCAWVISVVFTRRKLSWIYENRRDQRVVFFAGSIQQRKVSFVQRPHGVDRADVSCQTPPYRPQRLWRLNYLHAHLLRWSAMRIKRLLS